MYKKLTLLIVLVASNLLAQTQDKWRVNLGTMYVTDFSTQMQAVRDGGLFAGLIDTEDTLGMKSETNVFRIDGYYRFNDTHSIDFSYFRVKSAGSVIANGSFEYDGYKIDAGAQVDSYFNMSVYKVNYGYSFYHNDKVELMLTAGLHVTTIDLGLSAYGNVTDSNGNASVINYNENAISATLPLPVIGFKGEYTIIDDTLFVSYKSEFFLLKFDDFKGSLLSSALSIDYKFYKGYGVGLGYNSNIIKVEDVTDGLHYKVENDLSGFMLNLSYTY